MSEIQQQGAMVDRVGMRFGAGLSAAALVLAFSVDLQIVVPITAAVLSMGALFGPSNTPLAWIYKGLRSTILKKVPPEPEPAAPPRFAQTLGAFVLIASTLILYVYEAEMLGWSFALAVSVLQALLATTGICVGCEMYLLLKRLQQPRGTQGTA